MTSYTGYAKMRPFQYMLSYDRVPVTQRTQIIKVFCLLIGGSLEPERTCVCMCVHACVCCLVVTRYSILMTSGMALAR